MYFIGQDHIMNQLAGILPVLYSNPHKGENFLFRGPSGYGKTRMAKFICEYLAGSEYQIFLGSDKFDFSSRVIFIDEIHKCPDLESLYYLMDEKSHVLVFATNHDANLQEAFVNRCLDYHLVDYTDDELLLICVEYSPMKFSNESWMLLIEAGNRNPRIIKSLINRLIYYRDAFPNEPRTSDMKFLLEKVLGIHGGLDALAVRYLSILKELGGKASLTLMQSSLHLDRDTLTQQIEPALIRRGLIEISQKGRTLRYDTI